MKPKETKIFVGKKAFIKKGDKVLVLKDPFYIVGSQNTGLDFPGGRFRWGGNPEDELIREVIEETGLKIKINKPFTVWTNKKSLHKIIKKQIFLIGYLCEYVSGDIILSEEHESFEWVDKKSYKKWDDGSDYFKALDEYFKIKETDG
ncbi:hypothetical protein A3B39_00275 [Candidatus Daviesbacteria bacterium RIFCSPLOWO2_01_FULL_37_10]|nr:MAG: hypothetical protein A3B39_00275 [Candidatus Daviesbacteria bacterium RIFCSPLOWO2_01_FULL_37_10]